MTDRPIRIDSPSTLADLFQPAGLAADRPQSRSLWLNVLCMTLAGYALFGKGWAYLGAPPLFIGEMVLLWGMAALLVNGRLTGLFDRVSIWFLGALVAWGALRTWPYVSQYGIDALRDAVIWGYAAFAVVVYGYLAARPERLSVLVERYRQFAWIYPGTIAAVWLASRYLEGALPHWPWADVPVFDVKGGDALVHLGGVLAFFVSGLAGDVGRTRVVLLACSIGMVGAFNRGGLVSVLAVCALCFWLRPLNRNLWRVAATGVCGLTLLAATGFHVELPGKQRDVSFEQLVANVSSIAGDSGHDELGGTKKWRLRWWTDIYNYTVGGKYFWTGKGFGINLADDDGYQGTAWEGQLRSPHNGHLTMLARAGVPGFVLWTLVQLSWAGAVGAGYARSRRAGQENWSALFLFLLAYWTAFMANATFDVFLEGPMGGIWFWIVFGVGLAALWMHEQRPDALSPLAGDRSERTNVSST